MNYNKTNIKLIKNHLLGVYGLEIERIAAEERGFVAETYLAKTKGDNFFVKMVKKGRYDDNLVKSVEIQSRLCDLGLTHIPCPIPSRGGQSSTALGGYTFILFNYVKGKWTFKYKNQELLDILIDLHKINPDAVGEIEKEDFELPYREKLPRILERVRAENSKDEVMFKTSKYLDQFKKEIADDWENFNRLIVKCKRSSFDLKVTHNDPWGNVMRLEGGGICMFDWDDILLAPVERDLWFKLNDKKVVRYYKSSFPDYSINSLAYNFYLYNRYFYDFFGFLVEICSNTSIDHKEENYNLLLKDWHNWLYSLVREKIRKY